MYAIVNKPAEVCWLLLDIFDTLHSSFEIFVCIRRGGSLYLFACMTTSIDNILTGWGGGGGVRGCKLNFLCNDVLKIVGESVFR